MDRGRLAELFWDSQAAIVVERVKGIDRARAVSMLIQTYEHAWPCHWHGPLAGVELLRIQAQLRRMGASSPQGDAVLQLAATASFFHDFLGDRPKRRSIATEGLWNVGELRWPRVFRFADELQCWARPEFLPRQGELSDAGTRLDLGADRIVYSSGKRQFTIYVRRDKTSMTDEECTAKKKRIEEESSRARGVVEPIPELALLTHISVEWEPPERTRTDEERRTASRGARRS